jgi:methionyl-tRNA formyltransferase
VKIVFMGSPEFAVPSFDAVRARHEIVLAVTQPDKPAGRGRLVTAPPIKRAAELAGVPVLQPRSVRPPEVAAALAATGADLAVVVAYGKILPLAVLTAFPGGCVNVHGSILPAYRGAAPIQWSLIRGERETGVTIMKLDEGMDTGPTLLDRRLPIADDDTAGSLSIRLAELGAAALIEGLERIAAGDASWTPQDGARATSAPPLDKRDGALDFTQPARAVRDRVRGVDPWPGAVAALDGEPVKLFGAALGTGQGAPGELLGVDAAGVRIACGDGAVVLAEIQAPGKRRMSFAAFVRGRRLPPGTRLAALDAPAHVRG